MPLRAPACAAHTAARSSGVSSQALRSRTGGRMALSRTSQASTHACQRTIPRGALPHCLTTVRLLNRMAFCSGSQPLQLCWRGNPGRPQLHLYAAAAAEHAPVLAPSLPTTACQREAPGLRRARHLCRRDSGQLRRLLLQRRAACVVSNDERASSTHSVRPLGPAASTRHRSQRVGPKQCDPRRVGRRHGSQGDAPTRARPCKAPGCATLRSALGLFRLLQGFAKGAAMHTVPMPAVRFLPTEPPALSTAVCTAVEPADRGRRLPRKLAQAEQLHLEMAPGRPAAHSHFSSKLAKDRPDRPCPLEGAAP